MPVNNEFNKSLKYIDVSPTCAISCQIFDNFNEFFFSQYSILPVTHMGHNISGSNCPRVTAGILIEQALPTRSTSGGVQGVSVGNGSIRDGMASKCEKTADSSTKLHFKLTTKSPWSMQTAYQEASWSYSNA